MKEIKEAIRDTGDVYSSQRKQQEQAFKEEVYDVYDVL